MPVPHQIYAPHARHGLREPPEPELTDSSPDPDDLTPYERLAWLAHAGADRDDLVGEP